MFWPFKKWEKSGWKNKHLLKRKRNRYLSLLKVSKGSERLFPNICQETCWRPLMTSFFSYFLTQFSHQFLVHTLDPTSNIPPFQAVFARADCLVCIVYYDRRFIFYLTILYCGIQIWIPNSYDLNKKKPDIPSAVPKCLPHYNQNSSHCWHRPFLSHKPVDMLVR